MVALAGGKDIPNGKVATKAEARYSLTLLDMEAVKTLWPQYIRPWVEAVKRKDPAAGHWEPEHVRLAIDAGLAGKMFCECHLIVPVNEGKPVGVVILRLYNDEFLQVPLALHAWITYCHEPRAMRYVLPMLEKRAREIGVRSVMGISSRTKWLRRLRRWGYRMEAIIIRKDV